MPRTKVAKTKASALALPPPVRLAVCRRCGWKQPLERVHRSVFARRDRCGYRWLCSACLVDLASPRPDESDSMCSEFEYSSPATQVVARSDCIAAPAGNPKVSPQARRRQIQIAKFTTCRERTPPTMTS
jgi:hypothetical protein